MKIKKTILFSLILFLSQVAVVGAQASNKRIKVVVENTTMGNADKVTLTIWLRGGKLFESKLGVSGVANRAWLIGGTSTYNYDSMKSLMSQGVSIVSSVGDVSHPGASKADYLEWKISCSWSKCKEKLPLLFSIIKHPNFDQAAIDDAKIEFKSKAKVHYKLAYGPLLTASMGLIFGFDSPFGVVPQEPAINSISRQDVIDYATTVLGQTSLVVGVEGNIIESEARTFIENTWGEELPQTQSLRDTTQIKFNFNPGVYFFPVPKSSALFMSIVRPDYSIDFLNKNQTAWAQHRMFSGLFQFGYFIGRFVKELRFDKGLSYSPVFEDGLDWERTNFVGALSDGKLSKAKDFFEAFIGVVENLTHPNHLINDSELQSTKNVLLSNATFEYLATTETRLKSRMMIALHDYPETFYQDAYKAVSKLTTSEMKKFIKDNWSDLNSFAVVIVGPPESVVDGKKQKMIDIVKAFAAKHHLGPVTTNSTKITW